MSWGTYAAHLDADPIPLPTVERAPIPDGAAVADTLAALTAHGQHASEIVERVGWPRLDVVAALRALEAAGYAEARIGRDVRMMWRRR